MSVIKAERKEGELQVLLQARSLCIYTIQICKSEKIFPKRNRWIITNDIAELAKRILFDVKCANAIRIDSEENRRKRLDLQEDARLNAEALLEMITVAYEAIGIDADRVEYWTSEIVRFEQLLSRWKTSTKNTKIKSEE